MNRITNRDWHTTKFSRLDQRKVLHRLWELENEKEDENKESSQSQNDILDKLKDKLEELEYFLMNCDNGNIDPRDICVEILEFIEDNKKQ